MIWSPIDVAAEAYANGITGRTNLTLFVAVCAAESGFDDQAKYENMKDGVVDSTDRGLMQINDKWHPDVSDECAYDGKCNIDAAVQIFRDWGSKFNAWSAYKNLSYQKYTAPAGGLAGVAVDAFFRLRKSEVAYSVLSAEKLTLEEQIAAANSQLAALQTAYDAMSVIASNQQLDLEAQVAKYEKARGAFAAWTDSIWS